MTADKLPARVQQPDSGINYLDFLANAGFDLEGDVARQVDEAPIERLQDFRERYLDLVKVFEGQTGLSNIEYDDKEMLASLGDSLAGRVFACPDSKPGEFRPLFHGRILETGKTMLGGDSGSDFDELNLEARLRRVKGLLLYAHSIVVPDSLFFINQFFHREGGDRISTYFEQSRRQLRNYLCLIAVLRPLIRDGIVIFYPQFEHGGLGFGENRAFTDYEFKLWLEGRTPDISSKELLFADVGHSIVNEMLFFANRYEAAAVIDSRFAPALKHLVDFEEKPVRTDQRRDARITWDLASVDLPELDALQLREVVALRSHADSFAQWRTHLANAVEKIDNFQELPPEKGLMEIREILREGQEQIAKDMAKTSTWTLAVEGASKFGISTLAGLVATATFDPHTAAAASLLTFLHQYMKGSSKRQAQRSLKTHFASFTGVAL